ncbi:MAG: hypothetical protein HUU34_15465 [Saprospiraceae bacterium]|jgi:hypothetical protein|nr:hypothetical protein [Saprospiraceae bacterium]
MPYSFIKNKWGFFALLLSLSALATAQPTPILLRNASFEDDPAISQPPREWYYCGPPEETPPDVQPNEVFGKNQDAHHGYSYLAMVVRDNNTWEAVGQRLLQPLIAGRCYEFSVFLARPVIYQSPSRLTGFLDNYIRPICLRIWGGGPRCDRREILAASPPVKSTDWTKYTFQIQPFEDVHNLVLEAYYLPEKVPYNGGLFLDAASPVFELDCESRQKLLAVRKVVFSQPSNINELEALIQAQLQALTVDSTSGQLSIQYFTDPHGIDRQANIPLWVIAQALQSFTAWKLEIVVPDHPSHSARELANEITRELLAAGLPGKQLKVRTAVKRDKKRTWPLQGRDGLVWARVW